MNTVLEMDLDEFFLYTSWQIEKNQLEEDRIEDEKMQQRIKNAQQGR